MTRLFVEMLNISVIASAIVAAALIFRVAFRKAPKWMRCVIWAIVGLRLLIPLNSPVGFIRIADPVPQDVLQVSQNADLAPDGIPKESGAAAADNKGDVASYADASLPDLSSPASVPGSTEPAVSPHAGTAVPKAETEDGGGSPARSASDVAAAVWVFGAGAMLAYLAVGYIRIRRRVRESYRTEEGVYICDHVSTPFILGVAKPRIYLPSDITGKAFGFVIAHEKAHLLRHDHWWKPVGFLLLSAYWFNPVMWLAYILLCRDIEYACDEKVIKLNGDSAKSDYTETLLKYSTPRYSVSACPPAFAETGVKERVRMVLSYKKPKIRLIVVSAVFCIAAAVLLFTVTANSSNADPDKSDAQTAAINGQLYEKAFDLNDPETWYAPSVKNEVALEDAEKITVGMSFESIVALLGRPLRDEGSGGWIMVWQLENGDDLKIAFKRIPGTQISGDLIAFDINYRKPESDPATVGGAGDLVKAINETDKYNLPFERLNAYTYGDFMIQLTHGKKPSSSPKRTGDFSYGMQSINTFDVLYPIHKLTVINDDCIFAEYKLDNNGMLLHAFVVFDRYVGQSENVGEFELWQHHGEVYFAYPELNLERISVYKGDTVRIDELPFLIDLKYTARFINANGADSWRSEETLILRDGYAIINYSVDSSSSDMITITDITFIPYGEKCDKYPYNSLIANAYVPDFES